MVEVSNGNPVWRWVLLVAALLLLNASLAFRNVWPTPAVRWDGELSFELAACLLGLALASWRFGPPPRTVLRCLAVAWVLLAVGRYAVVTAPTMYGREINLFWDVRHVGAVSAMLARALSPWLVLVTSAAVLLTPLVLYGVFRWALGRVAGAMSRPRERHALALTGAVASLLFIGQRVSAGVPSVPQFSSPVIQSYFRQGRLLFTQLAAGPTILPADQPADSDLARIKGADVFIVFIESYGAVTYDRPEFATRLAAGRARLEADIQATRRHVVSAYVESPTFGGSSWLAHVSLMSGVEVRDENTNAVLMAQNRDTLVDTFKRHGYRTVAVMPGLWNPWPEGAYYRFDEVYGPDRLDYRGPRFGWWTIPDQFTIARLDALELDSRSRAPVFVFFATISTHAPFGPTAPYKTDWTRMLTDEAYRRSDLEEASAQGPDLLNLGPSYLRAVAYTYESLGGYLRMRADRDFVMILVGDHQPPAAVSGEGASWQVPVHVIASRLQPLKHLEVHGFRPGLTPERPVGHMHALRPMLLDAFGDPEQVKVTARGAKAD